VCALVFLRHTKDPEPIISIGHWQGVMIDNPKGSGGFGYDPYFYLPDLNQTAAELNPKIKNRISHRAVAMQQLVKQLIHV
jgi:XTP/dITP diphosphohydrolase